MDQVSIDKDKIEGLVIAMLSDEQGICSEAYNALCEMLGSVGMLNLLADVNLNTDDRFFLSPEE